MAVMEPGGGGDYVSPAAPRPPGGSRLKWVGVLVGFAVLVGVVALQRHSGNAPVVANPPATTETSSSRPSDPSSTTPDPSVSPTPTTASTPSTPTWTPDVTDPFTGFGGSPPTQTPATPSTSGLAVTVTTLPSTALPRSAGWEVVAWGGNSVVRIDPATGRVVEVDAGTSGSNNDPQFLMPGSGRTLLGGWGLTATVVPDSGPAVPARGLLVNAQQVVPGPDRSHLWATDADSATPATVRLVDWNGQPTGATITFPTYVADDVPYIQPDGAGYVLVSGIGGYYDARPGSLTLITHGIVLAAGPTGFLVYECGETPTCQSVVVSRTSGARRIVPGLTLAHPGSYQVGAISPDGSRAVFTETHTTSSSLETRLRIVDLTSGHDVRPAMDISPEAGFSSAPVALSPDGAHVVVAGEGELLVVDTATGLVHRFQLPATIPTLSILATRGGR